MIYTCPMHPEIRRSKPGTCPICGGMKLVPEKSVSAKSKNNYMPLIVVIGLLLLTTLTLSIMDMKYDNFYLFQSAIYFMTGFYIVFAGFKLMDLKGFAEGYANYDLLAQRVYAYGYVYPFIELAFGLGMIIAPQNRHLLWAELIVMTFSGIGVAIKILKREPFQCACLGTVLKVPLTYVTLIEDFGMAALALYMMLS